MLDAFLAIAYTEVTIHKRHSVKELALALDMAPSTLYGKLRGEKPMSMDERLSLIKITGNEALRDYVLNAMGVAEGNIVNLPKRKAGSS